MSSQTISRAVVQRLAWGALFFSVFGTALGAFFTAVGLIDSCNGVGSLFLFMVIGVVTGALVATSICLLRAAQRLPPTSLSPEAVAQEKKLQESFTLLFALVPAVVTTMLLGVIAIPKFIVIGGLGFIAFYWLFTLYLLYRGERMLHQGTAMSSSSGQG
jgi:hypothetical protein